MSEHRPDLLRYRSAGGLRDGQFAATCACGWIGPWRDKRKHAVQDTADHVHLAK